MGGGNGAKSAHKREMNAKNAKKGPSSQLASNAAALTIQCDVCKQAFQGTSKQPLLQQHVDSKHSKLAFTACFPKFVAA
ncbi:uncharacterized protein EHS24_007871 [Apiotrichum porosum]|uniref:Uncharacterized protein n=1 Tax=Apiotrichum porosum TaxID=105984 RepID=A0A427XSB3_9TREE|nr:uncharacterized protein EHS24_007871 [Apiotrichum porosum]RSH81688.1 hypothetical protein EHS24_007871 [Apiotrichum porosum]